MAKEIALQLVTVSSHFSALTASTLGTLGTRRPSANDVNLLLPRYAGRADLTRQIEYLQWYLEPGAIPSGELFTTHVYPYSGRTLDYLM